MPESLLLSAFDEVLLSKMSPEGGHAKLEEEGEAKAGDQGVIVADSSP